MSKFLAVILLFLLSFINSHAQEKGTVKGYVFSITDSIGLVGADVKLLLPDTDSVISVTSTYDEGEFIFENVPYNKYEIVFDFFGYPQESREIMLSSPELVLERVDMVEDMNLFKDIVIYGDIIASQQRGDTTILNADAYKVNPDATAEDLIRKMPGVDLSDGTPKVQGENVTKVLVDGKPFFGDDVNSTLKNIPAEMIQGVEVYDERNEQSQFSGFDDGQTTKTINLVTRENKRQGMFGKVYGGYGINSEDNYYNVGGTFNHFKGNQRITILGMTNNINIQNFSSEDLSGGSGGRGSGRGQQRRGGRPGGGSNDFMVDQRGGITQTNAAGVNYSNQWNDKIKLTGSYFFSRSSNYTDESLTRSYLSDFNYGQRYDETNTSRNEDMNHRLDFRLEYQIDSSNYISFSPNLRIQNTTGASMLRSNTYNPLGEFLSSSVNNYNTKSDMINGSYRFLYNHSFKKPGRTISLSNNSGFNSITGNNDLSALNTFMDTVDNEELLQWADVDRNGYNTYVNLNYTEPLTDLWRLQANAGLRYQHTESDKETNDYNDLSGEYDILNPRLSNKFESDYLTKFAGLAFAYSKNKIQFNAGTNYQLAEISSNSILPVSYEYANRFANILPYASLGYNFSKTKSFRLRYSTSTNTPSVTQLQNVLDNSNTMILRTGNPNLDQNYDHRFFMNYRSNNTSKNSSFFAMMMLNLTNNYVGSSTTIANEEMMVDEIILRPGMQYIKPVNINGYYRFMTHGVYSFRLKPIKSNVNLNAAYSVSNTPGLVNNATNNSISSMYNMGVSVGSNISEQVDFNIGTQMSYNTLVNSMNTSSDNAFYNQSTRLDVNYYILKNLYFNSQLNHQLYTGLTDGFNQNYLLWNMAVAYKFLKKQHAEVKLSVFDLLKQNQGISRINDQFYTQDSRSNVLQQYFMLTFTYNLRRFSGNSSEKDFQNDSSNRSFHGTPGQNVMPVGHPVH